MGKVGIAVGVGGYFGDERTYSKLACGKAVAQHIQLCFPWQLEGVRLGLVLVALDMHLAELEWEILDGLGDGCLTIKVGRKASLWGGIEALLGELEAIKETLAVREFLVDKLWVSRAHVEVGEVVKQEAERC